MPSQKRTGNPDEAAKTGSPGSKRAGGLIGSIGSLAKNAGGNPNPDPNPNPNPNPNLTLTLTLALNPPP